MTDELEIRLRALEGYSGQVEEWLAAGRVEIAIYNRYRRGRVANAEVLARSEVELITRRDHPMARRREIAVRALGEIPLALPVRPNSLTSVLAGLAAAQQFELDIRFEAGSTPLIRDVMLASDLATISPREATGTTPSVTSPCGSARSPRAASAQASASATSARARGSMRSPSSVSTTPRPVRWNSRPSMLRSSADNCRLSADCATPASAAVRA